MVSVVIPVYNNSALLTEVLDALSHQTFDSNRFEIIVVDNGSTEDIQLVTEKFPEVTLLYENENLNSPYSARNRGIEKATGKVIVLLDAKCIPSKEWLEAGIQDLHRLKADIVGGDIRFKFDTPVKASQVFDSLENVQMETVIKERGVAKGGNLFIRKKVFTEIGLFPEGVRSGADVSWTQKATANGLKLKFSPDAYVLYPARNFKSLVKKQWRVSKGQPEIWIENGKEVNLLYLSIVFLGTIILAPFRTEILHKLSSSNHQFSRWTMFKVYLLRYFISLIMKFGNLYGYLTNVKFQNES